MSQSSNKGALTLRRLRHAIHMLATGQLKGLVYKLLTRLRTVDLAPLSVDELGLPPERAIKYSDSGGPELEAVLRTLPIEAGDAVLDLGCGKGGALLTLARFGFTRLGGVDLSQQLVDIARQNLTRRGLQNVELYCCDAGKFVGFDEYNHIYMYNPFPCVVMKEVVDNLLGSLRRKPRRFTIVYKAPRCHEVIVEGGSFKKVAEFQYSENPFFVYSAAPLAATAVES